MQIEGLEAIDQKILEIIKNQARLSYKEIGEKAGISRISAKNHMEAMQEKGIIKGYHTVIDSKKSIDGIRFFLDISVTPAVYEDVIEYLAGSKYIRQIYSVSGECSIHAEGIISNSRNLEVFTNSLYRSMKKGIRQIKMTTLLSTIMDKDGGVDYVRYQEDDNLESRREESKS